MPEGRCESLGRSGCVKLQDEILLLLLRNSGVQDVSTMSNTNHSLSRWSVSKTRSNTVARQCFAPIIRDPACLRIQDEAPLGLAVPYFDRHAGLGYHWGAAFGAALALVQAARLSSKAFNGLGAKKARDRKAGVDPRMQTVPNPPPCPTCFICATPQLRWSFNELTMLICRRLIIGHHAIVFGVRKKLSLCHGALTSAGTLGQVI